LRKVRNGPGWRLSSKLPAVSRPSGRSVWAGAGGFFSPGRAEASIAPAPLASREAGFPAAFLPSLSPLSLPGLGVLLSSGEPAVGSSAAAGRPSVAGSPGLPRGADAFARGAASRASLLRVEEAPEGSSPFLPQPLALTLARTTHTARGRRARIAASFQGE